MLQEMPFPFAAGIANVAVMDIINDQPSPLKFVTLFFLSETPLKKYTIRSMTVCDTIPRLQETVHFR